MKVKLAVVGGKRAGMEIPISTPTFVIGRDAHCHLRPQSNLVGQIHCQISVGNGAVAIEDGSNAVGTFVNGEKIKWRRTLKGGDRIKVGTLELEVRLAEDATKRSQVRKARPAERSPHTSCADRGATAVGGSSGLSAHGVCGIRSGISAHGVCGLRSEVPHGATDRAARGMLAAAHGRQANTLRAGKDQAGWDWFDLALLTVIVGLTVFLALRCLPVVWESRNVICQVQKWPWWVWSAICATALTWLLKMRAQQQT